MLRPVSTLRIPEPARSKLQELGYLHCEDIELALLDLESTPKSVKSIIDVYRIAEQIDKTKVPKPQTAVDLWQFECYNSHIAVFHKALDKLLDGGIPVTRITELCGAPGCGKTQFCLQLSIDVQMPSALGGSSGESLYISTDFGFRVVRLRQMAEACVEHCKSIPDLESSVLENFTVDSILNGVNVISITGYEKLQQVVNKLEDYLKTNDKIKLIIVDSFSLPLVCQVTDLLLRTKLIYKMMDVFQMLALKYKLAVVLTNQLTTIITPNEDKKVIPSLGEGFGHRLHQRLLLDNGKIYLTKSISRAQVYTNFEITKSGVR